MKNNEIIELLKNTYPRDIRKQLVKTIQINEKSCTSVEIKEHYLMINQIMSYVLKELNWQIGTNSSTWDETPLKIMAEVFPNIEDTKWYKEQNVLIDSAIDVVMDK